MGRYTYLIWNSHVYLLVLLLSQCTADQCVPKGPCSCEYSNGTGIDLAPAVKATFYKTQTYQLKNNGLQYELNTYYYHPCFDVLLTENTTAVVNTCVKPLSVCRHKYVMNWNTTNTFKIDGGNNEFLGQTNVSKFSADGSSIAYFNPPSETVVMLICAQVDGELQVISEKEPDALVLGFYSKHACLKKLNEPSDSGRSLGSTLLVIFFSFVILYLVLGICTKKFLMGATGLEVIPNLGFWSDLPNLVKDGWAFGLNGFKLPARGAAAVASPDPNSYDSI